MIIKQTYTPDTHKVLSWEELKIGDVYYHPFVKTVNMKTSKNSYISFDDKRYHTRGKLLQGSTGKIYCLVNAEFRFELLEGMIKC